MYNVYLQWKSGRDNSADKSYSIKLVARYVSNIQCTQFLFPWWRTFSFSDKEMSGRDRMRGSGTQLIFVSIANNGVGVYFRRWHTFIYVCHPNKEIRQPKGQVCHYKHTLRGNFCRKFTPFWRNFHNAKNAFAFNKWQIWGMGSGDNSAYKSHSIWTDHLPYACIYFLGNLLHVLPELCCLLVHPPICWSHLQEEELVITRQINLTHSRPRRAATALLYLLGN